MFIDSVPLWYFQTNTYVIAPEPGGPAVVIDAPPDPEGVGDLLATHDLTPIALLVTHGHIDHVGGVDGVAKGSITTYLHPNDVEMARHPREQIRMLLGEQADAFDGPVVTTPFTDLTQGQVLDLAGVPITVLHTPGHSPGHCCFHVPAEGVLFTGDQLFKGSIGRTDLPGGSYEQLMESMRDSVLPLDDATAVLPGHGPSTTLAAERVSNPFLKGLM